jgi:SAM-dependent methyltransferase
VTPDPDELLEEQVAYYRARAPEYDHWWVRQGQFDYGPEFNEAWQEEVAQLQAVLAAFRPEGDVLELAAGTGNWTRELAGYADKVTAVDVSPETLAINLEKVAGTPADVEYVVADVFDWRPDRRYDVVFFSFWLSHVPAGRFDEFWGLVDEALAPEGRVFLIDNAVPRTARDHPGVSERTLADGREYRIVKVYYEPEELEAKLAAIGWDVRAATTGPAFIYAEGRRARRT